MLLEPVFLDGIDTNGWKYDSKMVHEIFASELSLDMLSEESIRDKIIQSLHQASKYPVEPNRKFKALDGMLASARNIVARMYGIRNPEIKETEISTEIRIMVSSPSGHFQTQVVTGKSISDCLTSAKTQLDESVKIAVEKGFDLSDMRDPCWCFMEDIVAKLSH